MLTYERWIEEKQTYLTKKKEKLAKMVKHNKAYSKYFRFLLEHGEGDIFKENKDTRDFVSKRYWAVSKSKSRIR